MYNDEAIRRWAIRGSNWCRIKRGVAVRDGNAILIADEQPLVREGLAGILLRCDSTFRFVSVPHFSAVLTALAADEDIALAVVELDLPGLNFVEGIRKLRVHFPGVRVVALSATLEREQVVECLRAGVHGYIAKSMPFADIVEAVASVRQGRIFVPNIVGEEERRPSAPKKQEVSLSDRQREVLRRIAAGRSNKEIARELGITEGTVKVHVNAIFRALNVHNRIGAVAAMRELEVQPQAFEPVLPGLIRAPAKHLL